MTRILRKFNAFVDGYSTHLECEEVTTPNVQDHVETVSAGGLIGEYDVVLGIKKLEAKIKLNSRQRELMSKVGLAPGVHSAITFRSANVSEIDGSQENEVVQITGRLNPDSGSWQAKGVAMTEFGVGSILFYKHTMGSRVVHHIDWRNFIGIVDGVDRWQALRVGIGL